MQITKLDLPRCFSGEGPVWDGAEQGAVLYRYPCKGSFRWDPASGEHRSWDVPGIIGTMALRESGGAVLAPGDGIHTPDFETGETAQLALLAPANPDLQLTIGVSIAACPCGECR